MSIKRLSLFSMVAVLCLALVATPAQATDTDKIIDAFLEHVDETGGLTNEQKSSVRETIDDFSQDATSKSMSISSALLQMYPDYEDALIIAEEGAAKALESLNPLIEGEDKYLAADAAFFLARVMMSEDQHEDAIPVLDQVIEGDLSEFSLNSGNALYFSAVAKANLLMNKEAKESFQEFIQENPAAPERLRVSAWRQLEMLSAIEDGSLSDVFQRMDFSRRQLDLENTGENTQEQQDKIVNMLAELIKEQEKKECSSCSSCESQEQQDGENAKGESQGQGEGKSTQGGASQQPNSVVRRTFDNGPASPWSKLRDRSRDPANNAVKERLPARYRKVVEGYNESVNESDDSNN